MAAVSPRRTIDNGAFLIVNGGADYAPTVLAGGTETVSAGSATGDQIYGGASWSMGPRRTVTNETVEDGGTLAVGGASTATNTCSSVAARSNWRRQQPAYRFADFCGRRTTRSISLRSPAAGMATRR